jgi:hypothetical protein
LGNRAKRSSTRNVASRFPQKAFFGAGFVNGARVSLKADGPGRIVIEQIELPDWARPEQSREANA